MSGRHAELPETTAEVAEIVEDAWLRIDQNHVAHNAAQYAAVRVLAIKKIADGLTAARRLAHLDTLHQPRPWAGSVTGFVCTCGRGAHPCDVRTVLDGELAVAS